MGIRFRNFVSARNLHFSGQAVLEPGRCSHSIIQRRRLRRRDELYNAKYIVCSVRAEKQKRGKTTIGDILRGVSQSSEGLSQRTLSSPLLGPLTGWLAPFVSPQKSELSRKKDSRKSFRKRALRRILLDCRKQPTFRLPAPVLQRPSSIESDAVSNAVSFGISSCPDKLKKNVDDIPNKDCTSGDTEAMIDLKDESVEEYVDNSYTDSETRDGGTEKEQRNSNVPLQKQTQELLGDLKSLLLPAARSPPTLETVQILPWLFAFPAMLEMPAVEALASKFALSGLKIIDISEICRLNNISCRSTSTDKSLGSGPRWIFGHEVAWVGSSALPGAPLAAAASLHRAAHRCGGPLSKMPERNGIATVITYSSSTELKVASEAFALYLHLYCDFHAKEAMNIAGGIFNTSPTSESSLNTGIEAAAAIGQGWLQRVILKWPYWVGSKIEVTGDLVGGWNRRVPLQFFKEQEVWRTQLWGVPPGVHQYKFIVDGRWCADLAAPSLLDEYGNVNNVVSVLGCCIVTAESEVADASDGMAASSTSMILDNTVSWEWDLGKVPVSNISKSPTEASLDIAVSPSERLQLARFGAAILAYYCKYASDANEYN